MSHSTSRNIWKHDLLLENATDRWVMSKGYRLKLTINRFRLALAVNHESETPLFDIYAVPGTTLAHSKASIDHAEKVIVERIPVENIQFTDSAMFVRSGIPEGTAYGEHHNGKGWFVQVDRFAWIERKTLTRPPAERTETPSIEVAVGSEVVEPVPMDVAEPMDVDTPALAEDVTETDTPALAEEVTETTDAVPVSEAMEPNVDPGKLAASEPSEQPSEPMASAQEPPVADAAEIKAPLPDQGEEPSSMEAAPPLASDPPQVIKEEPVAAVLDAEAPETATGSTGEGEPKRDETVPVVPGPQEPTKEEPRVNEE